MPILSTYVLNFIIDIVKKSYNIHIIIITNFLLPDNKKTETSIIIITLLYIKLKNKKYNWFKR